MNFAKSTLDKATAELASAIAASSESRWRDAFRADPRSVQIRTLKHLVQVAEWRRSVVGSRHVGCAANPIPAAFVLGMPGRQIWLALCDGLWLYPKPSTQEAPNANRPT